MKTKLFILCTALVLGLVSCNSNNKNSGESQSTESQTSEATTESSSSEETINMTVSYAKARNEFKIVTGLELPALENLEVEEYPFNEEATDYCFDITGGSALNYATYQIFESFFMTTLGECDEGYPDGDEATGRDAEWTTSSNRWYQTYWDATNQSIYINTFVKIID